MKKYVSIIAIMLCALIVNVKANTTGDEQKQAKKTELCCKDCKDEKCKELCKKWDGLTAEAQQGEEGKKIKAECTKMCEEKKCCHADGKSCEGKEGKAACCKKK